MFDAQIYNYPGLCCEEQILVNNLTNIINVLPILSNYKAYIKAFISFDHQQILL
jgi:hypothetical protein